MVNLHQPSSDALNALGALPRLLLAYAPASARPWHLLCWQLDQRLAEVVRRQGDPTIKAIRLAWWDAVLVERDASKGTGDPLVEQWRLLAGDEAGRAAGHLIDGWRMLASPDALSEDELADYAQGRGRGLFALLGADGAEDALVRAGSIWVLWDLAGHLRDEAQAAAAIKVAQGIWAQGKDEVVLRSLPRPLRLLATVALRDVRAGRVPVDGFTIRHYTHLLIAGLRR